MSCRRWEQALKSNPSKEGFYVWILYMCVCVREREREEISMEEGRVQLKIN